MLRNLFILGFFAYVLAPVVAVGIAQYRMKECWKVHGIDFACRAGLAGYEQALRTDRRIP